MGNIFAAKELNEPSWKYHRKCNDMFLLMGRMISSTLRPLFSRMKGSTVFSNNADLTEDHNLLLDVTFVGDGDGKELASGEYFPRTNGP